MHEHPGKDASGNPARSISREQMANLPIRRYEGAVCVIASADDLERAVADVRAERVVGFDTETRPSFTKGEVYLPSLVQVATARAVYLFRFDAIDIASAMAELLEDARLVKAGVSIAGDLRALGARFPFAARNVLDLGTVARRAGFAQSGVRNLAGLFLGYRIPKGARTSNWAAARLNSQQITYAATDAWICRELYLKFEDLGLLV